VEVTRALPNIIGIDLDICRLFVFSSNSRVGKRFPTRSIFFFFFFFFFFFCCCCSHLVSAR